MTSFGQALQALKGDSVVRRASWPKDQWLIFSTGYVPILMPDGRYRRVLDVLGKTKPTHVPIAPRLDLHCEEEGIVTGWTPSTLDLFATDWEFVVEVPRKLMSKE